LGAGLRYASHTFLITLLGGLGGQPELGLESGRSVLRRFELPETVLLERHAATRFAARLARPGGFQRRRLLRVGRSFTCTTSHNRTHYH